MKVAIVHYWLTGMRGGEKVIDALCGMFPQANIFTHVYVPEAVSETIRRHDVSTTFINALPRAPRWYKNYLPLMPMALEQLDLRGYDLIISSKSGPAKGIVAPPGSLHICYCHSPMRYVWNMYHEYRDRSGPFKRMLMTPFAHYLRMWDAQSASRVDHYIANSKNVAGRIHRYYGRSSDVIHPPVDVDAFEVVGEDQLDDYYLMVGELVAYKRPDLAVRAFNQMGLRLIIIGGGEMLAEIRRLAGPTVTVMGAQPFDVLRHHTARTFSGVRPLVSPEPDNSRRGSYVGLTVLRSFFGLAEQRRQRPFAHAGALSVIGHEQEPPGRVAVGLGRDAVGLVLEDAHPLHRGLGKADGLADPRCEDPIAEVLLEDLDRLLGVDRARIDQRGKDTLDVDVRVQVLADHRECVLELDQATHREILALDGDDHLVGRRQGVDRQQPEARGVSMQMKS